MQWRCEVRKLDYGHLKPMALCIALALIALSHLNAQGGILPVAGARGAGMGHAGVVFTDIQSALSNQAGLAFLERPAATVFGEQRFMLAELRSLGAAFAMPAGAGAFGLTLHYFGMDAYNEQRAGLAYSRQLFAGTSIGAQFNVFTSRIPDYGNTLHLNAEVGLLTQLAPQLRLGFHLANPVRTETRGGDKMPAVIRTGLGYQASDKVMCVLELEKDMDFPLRTKAGMEYRPAESVFLRIGAATQPALASLGAGFILPGGWALDFSASYHQFLGLTPSFSLTYSKPNRS